MAPTPLTPASTPAPWSDPRILTVGSAVMLGCLLVAALAGVSLLVPIMIALGVGALVMLFRTPLLFLALLIIIRMSLDYSAQFVTVTLMERSVSLSQMMGVGIAVLGLVFTLIHWRSFAHYPLTLPYGTVLIWGLGTLVYSIVPLTSLQEILRVFDLFVVGFIAYVSVQRYRDYRFLLMAIFISSALPILLGIYQFTFGIGLSDESVSALRIFGTFSHPNVFSLYLFTVAAITSMYFLVYARRDNVRLLTLLYLGLVLLTLLLTYARIAWVSLFIFVLLVAVWRFRFLLLPLILLPLVLATFVPAVEERVSDALHPAPDSSIIWRQNLWHDMILKTTLEDRIVLGSGIDTFRTSAEALRGERFGSNESHNDFIKFYVDGGMIGVFVFFIYLITVMFPVLHIRRLTPSHSLRNLSTLLALLVLTLTIASLSDNVFKNTPVQWLLSIVIGGFLALYRSSLPTELQR